MNIICHLIPERCVSGCNIAQKSVETEAETLADRQFCKEIVVWVQKVASHKVLSAYPKHTRQIVPTHCVQTVKTQEPIVLWVDPSARTAGRALSSLNAAKNPSSPWRLSENLQVQSQRVVCQHTAADWFELCFTLQVSPEVLIPGEIFRVQ